MSRVKKLLLVALLATVPLASMAQRGRRVIAISDFQKPVIGTECPLTFTDVYLIEDTANTVRCDRSTDPPTWVELAGAGNPAGNLLEVQIKGAATAFGAGPGLTFNPATGETHSKILNKVKYVHQYATGGTGTSGDPWTGWVAPMLAAVEDGDRWHFAKGHYDNGGAELAIVDAGTFSLSGDGMGASVIECSGTDDCLSFEPVDGQSSSISIRNMHLRQTGVMDAATDTVIRLGRITCKGGSNDGAVCSLDSDCPGGECFSLHAMDFNITSVKVDGDDGAYQGGIALSVNNANNGTLQDFSVDGAVGSFDFWGHGMVLFRDEPQHRGNVEILGGGLGKVGICGELGKDAGIINNLNFRGTKCVARSEYRMPGSIGFDIYTGADVVSFHGVQVEGFRTSYAVPSGRGAITIVDGWISEFAGGLCLSDTPVTECADLTSPSSDCNGTDCTIIDGTAIDVTGEADNISVINTRFTTDECVNDTSGDCGTGLKLGGTTNDGLLWMNNKYNHLATKGTVIDLGGQTPTSMFASDDVVALPKYLAGDLAVSGVVTSSVLGESFRADRLNGAPFFYFAGGGTDFARLQCNNATSPATCAFADAGGTAFHTFGLTGDYVSAGTVQSTGIGVNETPVLGGIEVDRDPGDPFLRFRRAGVIASSIRGTAIGTTGFFDEVDGLVASIDTTGKLTATGGVEATGVGINEPPVVGGFEIDRLTASGPPFLQGRRDGVVAGSIRWTDIGTTSFFDEVGGSVASIDTTGKLSTTGPVEATGIGVNEPATVGGIEIDRLTASGDPFVQLRRDGAVAGSLRATAIGTLALLDEGGVPQFTVDTNGDAVVVGDTLDVGDTASGSDVNRINIHGRAGASPPLRRGGAQTWYTGNTSAGEQIACEQFVNSSNQMVFSDAEQSATGDEGKLAIGCGTGNVKVGGEFTVTSGSVDFERTDALSGVTIRRNNTSAPSAGEDVAVLVGSGENDAGTEDTPYGTVTISSVDVTAGSETGRVTLDAEGGVAGELVVDSDLVTAVSTLQADSGVRLGSGGPTITAGTGSPESVVTAPVGSLFLRTDGGAGTTLYVKESGTGSSGWVAK